MPVPLRRDPVLPLWLEASVRDSKNDQKLTDRSHIPPQKIVLDGFHRSLASQKNKNKVFDSCPYLSLSENRVLFFWFSKCSWEPRVYFHFA